MVTSRPALATLAAFLLSSCGNAEPRPATPAQPVAQTADATAVAPAPAPEPKGPFLYRYQGKTGPVYLLGTIHLMVSAKTDLDPIVWQSFTACSKVVLELDITSVNMVGAMMKMMDLTGPGLKAQLTEAEWTKLTGILEAVPANALERMQPWAAGLMLEMAGVDATKSMEMEFANFAKQNQMTIAALETIDDQLAALAAASGIDDLKKAIAEYDGNLDELNQLVETYKSGDLAAFTKIFEASDEASDKLKADKLLKERNERWIPQIEKMLREEGNVFIAVGAAHLYGEHGVLDLLEARGFTAERVLGGAAANDNAPRGSYLGAMRSAPSRRMTSPLR